MQDKIKLLKLIIPSVILTVASCSTAEVLYFANHLNSQFYSIVGFIASAIAVLLSFKLRKINNIDKHAKTYLIFITINLITGIILSLISIKLSWLSFLCFSLIVIMQWITFDFINCNITRKLICTVQERVNFDLDQINRKQFAFFFGGLISVLLVSIKLPIIFVMLLHSCCVFVIGFLQYRLIK